MFPPRCPEPPLDLPAGEIHVWAIALTAAAEDPARARILLSEDERERASRFVFDRHRSRYVTGRAALA